MIVDSLFSFSELAFQEFETQRYLTGLLEEEGFKVEKGVSGLPSSWWATWGRGSPVIALGSDIDCIPKASQKPGVAYHDPIIEGAPGHGEGHNSGVPLNITSAIAVSAGDAPDGAFKLADVASVGIIPKRATGKKCARSWRFTEDVGSDPKYPDLSARDAAAMREIDGV